MDSEMLRQGTARGPVGSLPFIIALVLANVLASPKVATFRPDTTPLDWIPVATEEQLPGRLWQDPLQLAYEAWSEIEDDEAARAEVARVLFQSEASTAAPGARVLAVMVRGGAFPDDREERIRSRYAVVAGLGSRGYVPNDDQHIGYTVVDLEEPSAAAAERRADGGAPPGDGATASATFRRPLVLPFEWFRKGDELVLVLWIDELALGFHPLYRLEALFTRLRACRDSLGAIQVLGPTSTTGLVRMRRDDLQMGLRLPLWLAGIGPQPPRCLGGIEVYSSWATVDDADLYGGAPRTWSSGIRLVRTIGEDSSLAGLLREELALRIPSLYEGSRGRPSQVLSGVLRATRMFQVEESARVLLVTEADTEYGRSWSELFRTKQGVHHDVLQYLRGIDGMVPGHKAMADKPPKDEDGGAEPTAATGVGQFDYLERLDRSLQGRPYDAIGVLGSDVYDKLAILKVVKRRFPEAVLFTTDLDARLFPTRSAPETMNVVVASHYGLTLPKGAPFGAQTQAPFRSGYQTALWYSTRLALENEPDANGGGPDLPAPTVYEIGRRGDYALERATTATATTATTESTPQPTAGITPIEWGAGLVFLLLLAGGVALLLRPVHEDLLATRRGRELLERVDAAVEASKELERKVEGKLGGERQAGPEPVADPGEPGRANASVTPKRRRPRRRGVALVGLALFLLGITGVRVLLWPSSEAQAATFATSDVAEVHAGRGDELVGLLSVVALVFYCLILFRPVRHSIGGFFAYSGERSRVRELAAGLAIALAVASCFGVAMLVREPPPGGEPFELFAGISIWPTEILRFVAVLYCAFALVKIYGDLTRMNLLVQRVYLFEKDFPPLRRLTRRLGRWGFFARHTFDENAPSIRAAWRDYLADGLPAARLLRVIVGGFAFYTLSGLMFWQLGSPNVPYRGWASLLADRLLLFLSVAGMIVLIFYVLDVTLATARFLLRMRAGGDRIWSRLAKRHADATGLRADDVSEVVGVRLVERMSDTIGNFLYYPAVMLFLMLLSRSSLFDHWTWSAALILVFAFSFALLFGATRYIAYIARAIRDDSLERLQVDRLRHQREQERVAELDNSIAVIERIRGGAFAGFRDHPLTKAVLLPFAGLGAASLLEFVYPLWLGL